jgi:hypothetical protein
VSGGMEGRQSAAWCFEVECAGSRAPHGRWRWHAAVMRRARSAAVGQRGARAGGGRRRAAWARPRERRGTSARSAGEARGRPGRLQLLGQKGGGGPVKLRTPFSFINKFPDLLN